MSAGQGYLSTSQDSPAAPGLGPPESLLRSPGQSHGWARFQRVGSYRLRKPKVCVESADHWFWTTMALLRAYSMRTQLSLASVLLLLGSCAIPTVNGTARYLNFKPSGNLLISDGPTSAGNSMSDLGLANTDGALGAEVHLKWGMPHLSFSTQSSAWSGSGILNGEFSSGGITIGANTPVDSELELGLNTALLTWDFIPGSPELGIGFGLTMLDLRGSFESNLQRVEFDETLPVPMLAVRGAIALGPLDVAGHLAGISVDLDGDEASILDFDIHARYHLLGFDQRGSAYLVLGWRQFDLNVDVRSSSENIDADISFAGLYAGLQVSF